MSEPEQEYSALLLELNKLIATGKGDDDEADAVRDKMDVYWGRMSLQQQQQIRASMKHPDTDHEVAFGLLLTEEFGEVCADCEELVCGPRVAEDRHPQGEAE